MILATLLMLAAQDYYPPPYSEGGWRTLPDAAKLRELAVDRDQRVIRGLQAQVVEVPRKLARKRPASPVRFGPRDPEQQGVQALERAIAHRGRRTQLRQPQCRGFVEAAGDRGRVSGTHALLRCGRGPAPGPRRR